MTIIPIMILMIDEFEKICCNPSWEDVANAIHAMDGRSRLIVMVDTDEKTSLLLAEGTKGIF